MPLLETSAAAAVEAVGTIPAGTPGFERWTSLHATSTRETGLVKIAKITYPKIKPNIQS